MMTWQDLHHSELTVPQLYALLKLRSEVFVVEQQCVYQDVDGDDLVGENRHLLGWRDGELVAYARILKSEGVCAGGDWPGHRQPRRPWCEARLSADGAGAGQLSAALAAKVIYLGAQAHLQSFTPTLVLRR